MDMKIKKVISKYALKINQISDQWLSQINQVTIKTKQFLSKATLLALSTLLSACVFTTTCVFATTMTLTDTEISSQLHHDFSQNKNLAALKITPLVIKGVVSLQGTVPSVYQAIELIELTEKKKGVTHVDTSHLILKSTNKPIFITDDIYITAKLKDLYEQKQVFRSNKLDSLGIGVETKNGIVILNGVINEKRMKTTPEEYRAQVKNAINLAKEQKGVQSVDVKNLVLIVEYSE